MKEKVIVHTDYGNFKVDPKRLADNLKFAARVAKALGERPGEPVDLTHTKSDPISHERFETFMTIVLEHKAKTQ